MKRLLYILLVFVVTAQTCAALDIVCSPGAIASLLEGKEVDALTVSGSIDASDIFYVADNMPGLKTLDLSRCTITAYNGQPLKGRTQYPTDAIPPAAFAGTAIESVIFPATGTLAIGEGAFAGSRLKRLELPSVKAEIADGAFAACLSLGEVDIHAPATIGRYAFRGCTALRRADLTGVTSLGDKAFASCHALTTVVFDPALAKIGSSAFEGCALTAADLAATRVTALGDRAFADNSCLESITLPKGLKDLGKGAFFDCTALGDITIPAGCTTLPDYALKDSGLRDITMTNVSHIGAYSLKGASAMWHLALPPTLTAIGDNAMEGMSTLESINGSGLTTVPTLGNDVWDGVDQGNVYLIVKGSRVADFADTPQWKEFKIIDSESSGIAENQIADGLRGMITDGILHIETQGADMTLVEVYDPAGQLVATARPMARTCAIDITNHTSQIFIVRTTLADSTVASLKLAR